LTPDESAHWDGEALRYGPGAPRSEAPRDDELEDLFRTYYRATYNPARANMRLFRHHVPQDFQRDMPELTVLSEMATAKRKVATKEAAVVPASRSLSTLREAAVTCRACPLGELATQTVFGEGARKARLVMVGEQPGDQEDKQGHPFVGPAGQMLDRALEEAGIAREDVYITNAVKHFNYRPVGKKRLHQKPEWSHVEACRPWLRAELEAIEPEVILCLGATASQSFLGRRFTVLKNRGRVFETPWAKAFLVSYHPSAILRAPDDEAREQTYRALVDDLKVASNILAGHTPQLVAPD
ncbi:MAG TPA: UdgX family uracil-DNA binding protein, partial [Polyangiales bacterium]|nr:UdgX family uracil-DNA binding protein [Polyangiales bacterium]